MENVRPNCPNRLVNQRLLPFNDPKEEARLARVERLLSGERRLTTAARMFDYAEASKLATAPGSFALLPEACSSQLPTPSTESTNLPPEIARQQRTPHFNGSF